MTDHLTDPLEYLYEELSAEQMAEVRKHLAACAACRADMRSVRETVKQYRRIEKPSAPIGLATRTARRALESIGRGAARPVPPAPKTAPPAIDLDREFARLKEEVLREIPKGWRTWLFHPAWTVAAAVVFACAVLIHFSPRMNPVETRYIPTAPAGRDDDVVRKLRERERLPASMPRERGDEEAVPAIGSAEPILETAVIINETVPDIPVPAAPEAETAPEANVPPESGESDEPESSPELPEGATPIELLESFGEKTRALAGSDDSGVVIWEEIDSGAVPQLIERPPAYDPAERIQSLTALAGMQMASGEFVDAWRTVGILEQYDTHAAAALGITLRDLELAAKAREEAAPEPIPEPVFEPIPESEPESVPAPEPEPEPEPVPEPEPLPEPPFDPAPAPEPPQVPVTTVTTPRESVYVDTLVVPQPQSATVYAPMPMVPVMTPPPPRPARPFTTDPYFREY